MDFDERGPVGDRRWMLVDDQGVFLSQRVLPRLALLVPTLTSDGLRVQAPGLPPLEVTRPDPSTGHSEITGRVWDGQCRVVVADQEANEWFSRFLGRACRLVYQPDDAVLAMSPDYAGVIDSPRRIAFTDGSPLLLTGEASLDELNARLKQPLPMNRFRPNIVVRGAEPFAEDGWKRIAVGEMRFEVARPCPRCATTTVDQATGERGEEPLRTLATFRKRGSGVMFGQNATHHMPGRICVGEELQVLG
jgi:hypothetical protein